MNKTSNIYRFTVGENILNILDERCSKLKVNRSEMVRRLIKYSMLYEKVGFFYFHNTDVPKEKNNKILHLRLDKENIDNLNYISECYKLPKSQIIRKLIYDCTKGIPTSILDNEFYKEEGELTIKVTQFTYFWLDQLSYIKKLPLDKTLESIIDEYMQNNFWDLLENEKK